MADITMCYGEGCPFRYKCYRALANSHEFRQAYFITVPYDHEKGACEFFWNLDKDKSCESS
jgi:hypothetical protein